MLKKVISQLNDEQYEDFFRQLNENRGEKFAKLLELYRTSEQDEDELPDVLGIKQSAFYTLKSRLTDKTQEYLFHSAADSRAELIKNVATIPRLLYNTPRETAISLLEHLESELQKYDLQRELIRVYHALQKLHSHTEKYFQYQQLYNKTVAYALAADKADDLVTSFNRELGEYLLSGDESHTDILLLHLKELSNLSRLYESHRLRSSLLLTSVAFSVFAGNGADIPESQETVQDALQELSTIYEKNPDDRYYHFFVSALHFLEFEYYHRLGLHRNAQVPYEKVSAVQRSFLLLCHSVPAARFLVSGTEHALAVNAAGKIYGELKNIAYESDPAHAFDFVTHSLGIAVAAFHAGEYPAGVSQLNDCINAVSFKNFPYAELQVKLLLALLQLLSGKVEQAEVTVRSVSRKFSADEFATRFPSSGAFIRLLKTAITDNSSKKQSKLEKIYAEFTAMNNGKFTVMKQVPLSSEHIALLCR